MDGKCQPPYRLANEASSEQGSYRLELRKGRTEALQLARKLVMGALTGEGVGKIPQQSIDAMTEIFREARETLAPDKRGPRPRSPLRISPEGMAETLRALENGELARKDEDA